MAKQLERKIIQCPHQPDCLKSNSQNLGEKDICYGRGDYTTYHQCVVYKKSLKQK